MRNDPMAAAGASPALRVAFAVVLPKYVSGRYSVKTLPTPGELRNWISPPRRLASSRLIASPSPVPPYLRLVPASAC